MRHVTLTVFLPGALAALPIADTAARPLLGPPWISVELPANPLDPSTRGAILVVRTYHHGQPIPRPLTCAFEGIVDGERTSMRCRAEDTRRPGVYAVRGDVPDAGVWMLVVSAGERRDLGTALVDFDGAGRVSGVRVPSRRDGRWTIPTGISDREVTSLLRARWNALSSTDPKSRGHVAGIGLLALLPLGGLLVRRLRARQVRPGSREA